MNLYLGGTFVYHLGKSEGESSVNVYYFGVEGGYDIYAAPVVIRPYLGLGAATAKVDVPGYDFGGVNVPGGSLRETKVAFWPGATVMYPIGNAFVCGDARFLVVDNFNVFSLFATGGLQF